MIPYATAADRGGGGAGSKHDLGGGRLVPVLGGDAGLLPLLPQRRHPSRRLHAGPAAARAARAPSAVEADLAVQAAAPGAAVAGRVPARCYKETARVLLLTIGALQLVAYPCR